MLVSLSCHLHNTADWLRHPQLTSWFLSSAQCDGVTEGVFEDRTEGDCGISRMMAEAAVPQQEHLGAGEAS